MTRDAAPFRGAAASRCFRRRAPRILPGPARSGKSPAKPGAPGPLRHPPTASPANPAAKSTPGAPSGRSPPPDPHFLSKTKASETGGRALPGRSATRGRGPSSQPARRVTAGPTGALPGPPPTNCPRAAPAPGASPKPRNSRRPAATPAAPRDADLGATHVPRPGSGSPGEEPRRRAPSRTPGPPARARRVPLLPRRFGLGRRRLRAGLRGARRTRTRAVVRGSGRRARTPGRGAGSRDAGRAPAGGSGSSRMGPHRALRRHRRK